MERRMTAAEREALRAQFLEEAAARWNDLFDPVRRGELRTFDQREAQAVELARGLGAKALEQHLRLEADGSNALAARCPMCGEACCLQSTVDGPSTRSVQTRVGQVEYRRPEYYCPRCRRSFFPGGPYVRAGDRGV
jgi:hypothetical protein